MVDTQFYINKGPFSLRQIAEICEAELADSGKADVVIKDIATMAKAGAEEICFFYDKKAKGKAAEILTGMTLQEKVGQVFVFLCRLCDNR